MTTVYKAQYNDGTTYEVDIHGGKSVTLYVVVDGKRKVARRIPAARWRWLTEWINRLLTKSDSPSNYSGCA